VLPSRRHDSADRSARIVDEDERVETRLKSAPRLAIVGPECSSSIAALRSAPLRASVWLHTEKIDERRPGGERCHYNDRYGSTILATSGGATSATRSDR